MQRRILILLAAAILAVLSATAVMAYARGADRRALEDREGRHVLLAIDLIPAGTTVAHIRSKRLVRQVLMPAGTVPSGALDKLDSSLDAMSLNAPLQPDQMLLRGQFRQGTPPTPSSTPTFPLPADRIAVSVELGIAPQVAGNVDPGDKVAVFETAPRVATEAEKQVTTLLLPNVTVISVGERSQATTPTPAPPMPVGGGSSASPSASASPAAVRAETLQRYVVTLAVTSAEAERLILAYNAGLLHLGLLGSKAKTTGGVA
jgi:pilus assembly protein CpaB